MINWKLFTDKPNIQERILIKRGIVLFSARIIWDGEKDLIRPDVGDYDFMYNDFIEDRSQWEYLDNLMSK